MKKTIITCICFLLLLSFPALAGEKNIPKTVVEIKPRPSSSLDVDIKLTRPYHNNNRFMFDWYKYNNTHAIGMKYQPIPDYYTTFNCEYDKSKNDLLLSVGAFYRIPKEVILWHFYLGGEYTYSRNEGTGDPYILVGTDFLIFFFESKLPITISGESVSRSGFRFNF